MIDWFYNVIEGVLGWFGDGTLFLVLFVLAFVGIVLSAVWMNGFCNHGGWLFSLLGL